MSEAFSPDSALVARLRPSPNHGERRGARRPEGVILHYTGTPTLETALDLLTDPKTEVSAHYVVAEAGEIWQLAPEARRAWHAGVSSWKGERDLNSTTIGVEIQNPGHDGGLPEFAPAQIDAVVALVRDIANRWRIRPERILGHSDIAPARKRDPGERFPWPQLAAHGIGHWVAPAGIEGGALIGPAERSPAVSAVQTLLSLYGYGVELTGALDRQTELAVAAFQRHFRPERVDGQVDASTLKTLNALIEALRP